MADTLKNSFHADMMASSERTFYARLIQDYGNHDVGRIYRITKQHDRTLYSGDNRGYGQGGYVSNVVDNHFVRCTKADYDAQKANDDKVKTRRENLVLKITLLRDKYNKDEIDFDSMLRDSVRLVDDYDSGRI
jgi:hypothetical protein